MARPRSSGYDGQREQILAAAAALFARQGYTASTMNQVAAACGVSKATLYHYVRDKHALLAQIARGHVERLQALVAEVAVLGLAPETHLRVLIERFTAAYASAQHEHRVLTEDVKFLDVAERDAVVEGQRQVVAAFARAVAAVRPDLAEAELAKPMAMLLFGMINWTFTWMRPDGPLTHQALAPIVSALFFGGLPAVAAPSSVPRGVPRTRASRARVGAAA
ncbi:MAG: TetR/AcrR family transcriptional regulator [Rubrivivax sp.]|nr:TetR/AcrR family transcriptional regulator [Rubrivivax sp.]